MPMISYEHDLDSVCERREPAEFLWLRLLMAEQGETRSKPLVGTIEAFVGLSASRQDSQAG